MDRPRVDYNAIVTQRTLDGRIEAMMREIEKSGYVCLTDAISHYEFGGALMLERLMRDHEDKMPTGEQRRWKLFVMRDEWGNAPKPGEKIVRAVMRKRVDAAGRKMRSRAINDMKRRGTYDKQFVHKREFVVDDKGCIECTIDDAAWFLMEYGVNFESPTEALCGRREISGSPCRAPDGSFKHVWYWRYYEAPPWVYDKMPSISNPEKTRKPRSKKSDITEQVHSSPDTKPGDAEA